ncbi:hypothetical protein GC177_08565 [bacterium]|nr:hypothetical protein [bacterium]
MYDRRLDSSLRWNDEQTMPFSDWLYDWHEPSHITRECARLLKARSANLHFDITPADWTALEQAHIIAQTVDVAHHGEMAECRLTKEQGQAEYRLNESTSHPIHLPKIPENPSLPWLQTALKDLKQDALLVLAAPQKTKQDQVKNLLAAMPQPPACAIWFYSEGDIQSWPPSPSAK